MRFLLLVDDFELPAGGRAFSVGAALRHRQTVLVTVTARNRAGLKNASTSIPVVVDLTPPVVGELREASVLYEKALRARIELLGEFDPETDRTRHSLAATLEVQR